MLSYIDFFAGCGGITYGFQKAGLENICAVENWIPSIKVYEQNFPKHTVHALDISNVQSIVDKFSHLKGKIDLIVGGPPCQDFTRAGAQDESKGRADLTIKFAEIILALKPRWFLMENVNTARHKTTYQTAVEMLETKYACTLNVLNASHYNVPQARKRLFCVGTLDNKEKILAYERYLIEGASLIPMSLKAFFKDRIRHDFLFKPYRISKNKIRNSNQGISSVHAPSSTITASDQYSDTVFSVYLPTPIDLTFLGDPRVTAITPKDCALIQTFPDSFSFDGITQKDMVQMIGNAVPCNLAYYLAECIKAADKGLLQPPRNPPLPPTHNQNISLGLVK